MENKYIYKMLDYIINNIEKFSYDKRITLIEIYVKLLNILERSDK